MAQVLRRLFRRERKLEKLARLLVELEGVVHPPLRRA
jgi:hypothetical protein